MEFANLPAEWQEFLQVAQTTLPCAIPSLRFLSMLYVPMLSQDLNAYYFRNYDEEETAWWLVAAHEGDSTSQLLKTMPVEAGERVHRYLLSDKFAETLDLNGE